MSALDPHGGRHNAPRRHPRAYPRRYPPQSWDAGGGMQAGPPGLPGAAPPQSPLAAAAPPAPGDTPTPLPVPDPAREGWRLADTIPSALSGIGRAIAGNAGQARSRPGGQTAVQTGRRFWRPGGERRPADPSPSLFTYRLNRLWLTPVFRRAMTLGLPALLLAGSIIGYLADDTRRAAVTSLISDMRLAFESRPEFRVMELAVHAESPIVARAISDMLDGALPASSFHLDLDALRAQIERFDAVETAALRIRHGGVLDVSVREREPAFVWRSHDGLVLIDADGHRVALLTQRAARADLPLIAGDGAPQAVAEARRLLAAAAPLGDRLLALVRVGERRWDLVLVGDLRIMLPPQGAVMALERVLALDNQPMDLLARDIVAVDMRNPDRLTIRLSETAMAELHRNRSPER